MTPGRCPNIIARGGPPALLSVTIAVCCHLALLGAPAAASAGEIRVQIRIKTARVTGNPLASKVFESTVNARQPGLLRCYQEHLAKHPGVVGLLGLTVRIEPTGKVAKVTAQPTRVPKPLVDCAIKAVHGWQVADWKVPQRAFADLELVFQLSAPLPSGASAKGGIKEDLVSGTIQSRLKALHDECWTEKVPARSPTLRLVTDFDGTIQTADLSGRIPNRTIHRCLVTRLKTWDFPPPDNGHRTWIYYPLFPAQRPTAQSRPPRDGR